MSPTVNDFPPSVKANRHNVRRFSRCTNDTGFAHVYNPSNYHARTQRLSTRRATNCKESKTQATQNTLIQLPTMRHSKPKTTTIPGFSQAKPRLSLTHTYTPLSNTYCFQVLSLGGVGGVRSKIQRCLGVVSFPPPLLVRQPPHIPPSPPLTATTLPFPKIEPSTKQPLLFNIRAIPNPYLQPVGFYVSS